MVIISNIAGRLKLILCGVSVEIDVTGVPWWTLQVIHYPPGPDRKIESVKGWRLGPYPSWGEHDIFNWKDAIWCNPFENVQCREMAISKTHQYFPILVVHFWSKFKPGTELEQAFSACGPGLEQATGEAHIRGKRQGAICSEMFLRT